MNKKLKFFKDMCKTNYSKARELASEMTIKGEEFKLLQHNPETDVWVFERTYGQKSGNIKKCIEVIRPFYSYINGERKALYPSDEQFGSHGYCCNIKDYHLQDKINFWLKNGIVSYTAKSASK